MTGQTRGRHTPGRYDWALLFVVTAMLGFGLVMVFSASYPRGLEGFDDPFYFIMRQLAWLALGLVAWRFHRNGLLPTQARWIGGLALLQLVTGLSNVVLDWPLVAAVLHTGGAAALVVVLTWTLVSSRAAPAPREFSAPTGASRVSA